jgi:hypothetical protein
MMFIFLNLDRSTNVQTQYWVAFRTCEKRDDLLVASGQETSAACWIGSPDFLWLAEPVRSYRQHLACIAGIGVGVFFPWHQLSWCKLPTRPWSWLWTIAS